MSEPVQPVTLLDYLNLSVNWLESKGIEDARLNVQLMLGKILNLNRMGLYLKFDYPLAPDEVTRLREFLSRRAKREPLQYILGEAQFMDFLLKVGPGVLIPRPETEELADLAIKTLLPFAGLRILEVGTGSGCLPVALAKKLAKPSVLSLDVSDEALRIARENLELFHAADQVTLLQTDFLCWTPKEAFDVIISNPPYIPEPEIASLQPEVRQFEPVSALTDGADGLSFYKALASCARHHLKPGGWIFLELHEVTAPVVAALFKPVLEDVEIVRDMQGKPRILKGKK